MTPFALTVSVVLMAGVAPNGMAQSRAVECDPAHAVLTVDSSVRRLPAFLLPGGARHNLGDLRVFLQEDHALVAERIRDGRVVWQVAPRESEEFEILGCSEVGVYLRSWRSARPSGTRVEPADLLRIEVVDAATGRLRDFARIPPPHGKPPEAAISVAEVWDLLCDHGVVYVLSAHRTERLPVSDQLLLKYQVSAFDESSGKRIWQREYDPSPDAPTVDFNTDVSGRFGRTGIRPLGTAGQTLLVCAGSQQPILALDSHTGLDRWRLDAIWEYRRGYTSFVPYAVYFTRFGVSPDEFHDLLRQPDPVVRAAEQARVHSEFLRRFRLFAGPVSVPFDGGYRTFLAVGDCDPHWPEETAVCDIYEVDDRGRPVSILRLPRPPRGDAWTIHGESVQWICRGGGIARFGPTFYGHYDGREPDHDALGRLEWFVETRAANWQPVVWHANGPWLTTGISVEDPVACNERYAAFVPAGGWVESPLDRTFHLPLALLDLRTRDRHVLDLAIPLGRPVPPPTDNCLTMGPKQGTNSGSVYHAHGSYGVSVTDLEWVGTQLEITIAVEEGPSYRLRFAEACPR